MTRDTSDIRYHRLPPLTEEEKLIRFYLKQDVIALSHDIGERSYKKYENLIAAVGFIENTLSEFGFPVEQQEYQAKGESFINLHAEIKGNKYPEEIVLIGAHYDSFSGSPGANDNASGVAGVLALARLLSKLEFPRTIRFAFFANEEPPFFYTAQMGSRAYAKWCREKQDKLVAALIFESIAYYKDYPNVDDSAAPFVFQVEGDFIAFIGNEFSSALVDRIAESFNKHINLPEEMGFSSSLITTADWSDNWSFCQEGYDAIMITDTSIVKYLPYHTEHDTVDKIEFNRAAKMVVGIKKVIEELAQ